MADLVERGLPCDECGSSDAKAVYSDGSTYCFSCEAHSRAEPGRAVTRRTGPRDVDGPMAQALKDWTRRTPKSIPDRGIAAIIAKKYGVWVTPAQHYYPYYDGDSTEPVGFKVRNTVNKDFRSIGDMKSAGLFGEQRYGNYDRKRIVVTEGELDALAAAQLLEDKVPVVSLRSGAGGAARDFTASYKILDGFAEIVLCFDADDAGREGVKKAASVFGGKVRSMRLDATVGKDACDYLLGGHSKAFTDLYWSSSPVAPAGVLSKEELLERLLAPRPASLGDYPWRGLNKLTWGFRPTELIMLCAGSGLGKSAVLREIVMHIKQTTDHRVGVLMMEESVERTAEGFMSIDLSTPLHLPHSTVDRGSDDYMSSYDRVYGDDRIHIMDASFDCGATVDEVVSRVRYMVKALDCKVVILDHISILVSGGQHGDERRALDEIMTKLRTLTQDTGIALFAVSHLKRPEGKGHEEGAVTSVGQLRGSAAIAQLSDFVIGLERNAQADDEELRNTTTMRVLKNRFSGLTGPAGALRYDTDTGRLTETDIPGQDDEAL